MIDEATLAVTFLLSSIPLIVVAYFFHRLWPIALRPLFVDDDRAQLTGGPVIPFGLLVVIAVTILVANEFAARFGVDPAVTAVVSTVVRFAAFGLFVVWSSRWLPRP
jgi:hypothetical protein